MPSISNPPRNDYFSRQKRLARQEEEAMRTILKIRDMEPKTGGDGNTYERKSPDGSKPAHMPGTKMYESPNMLEKLLQMLKIKKRQDIQPRTPIDSRAGRSGYI